MQVLDSRIGIVLLLGYYGEGKALGIMQCLWFEKLGFNCKEGL